MTVLEARKQIRHLFDDSDPSESPTAYYALFHAAAKSALFTAPTESGRVNGFVGRFQTGVDLFRPLITLKCPNPHVAADLLSQALVIGRPYILFAGLNQLAMVGGSLHIENQRIQRIYTIDPTRFRRELNILVEHKTAHDGTPRCEMKSGGQTVATAGISWKSPAFAEIYLQVDAIGRQKGWGKSVLAALTETLLKMGVRAIYLVDNNDSNAREMVESLGYVDTGSRQVYADTVYQGNPT